PITVSQGSRAWLWKITARSRLGPSIAWLSTITAPSDGRASPARRLRTVGLPQPEWPMMQANSPRAIDSQRSRNTVVSPPAAAGKRLLMPSIEMKRALTTGSFREGDEPGCPRQQLVEHHADQPDHQNGGDDVRDGEIVPLVPDEVADAGAADQHLSSDDHQPGDADRYPHARENRRCRRWQDHGEGAPD